MSLIDTRQGDIFELLTQNKAFKNPFDVKLLEINSTITSILPTIQTQITNPIEAQEIINAIQNLQTTLNRFKTHTDNISGVGLTNGLNGANLATISQIVSTVNKYKNESATCELIYKAFGAIINASRMIQLIDNALAVLRNATNFPDRVVQVLNTVISAIENQIQQDLLAFADAQLDALRLAVASAITNLFDDPCIGEIISIIGTNEAKQILRREIPSIRNQIPRI